MNIPILLVQIVQLIANILTLFIISDAILSFFLSPFHPLRQALGRILIPLYAPLRRVIPPVGGMDFSPIVLIILIQIIEYVIISLLV